MPPEDQPPASTEAPSIDAPAVESATDDPAALKVEIDRLKALGRKHEDRAKENYAWRKANEDKVRQYDALAEASKTEQEKAVEQARADAAAAARTEAASEALGKFGPRLVGAEFRAQLAGRIPAVEITKIVGGLDVRRFLTDDGEPDSEAVADYVAAIRAPVVEPAKAGRIDLGGGRRESAKVTGVQSGVDLYSQKHPPKKTTPA